VIVTWLAGVQAAMGLGAVSPVSAAVRSSLGLSLSTVAWATSSTTAVGAVLGIPVGWWASRVQPRRTLIAGLLVISAAAGLSALAESWALLLGLRTVEGAGYLLVFVAGPIVLTGLTRGRTRAAALALWGTCVPTGLAVAAAAGGALASELTWNRWLGVTGVGPLVLAGLLSVALPQVPISVTGRRSRAPDRWARFFVPAGAYACLSLIGVAMVVMLPVFLTGTRHETSARAGTVAAIVCACSAVGGILAGGLLRRGVTVRALTPLVTLMPLACLPAFSAEIPHYVGVSAAALVILVDGLLISVVFAVVPAVTGRAEDIDLANGALAQFGSLGTLIGPPVFGLAVGYAGWGAGTIAATSLFTVLGAGLLLVTAHSVTIATSNFPCPPTHPPGSGHGPAAPGEVLNRRSE
jgi:MFS family permease